MIKKEIFAVLLISALFFSLFSGISALETDSVSEGIQDNVDKAQDIKGNLDPNTIRSNYLKTEWRTILAKGAVGSFVLSALDLLGAFNPLFKIILGVEYSLSWAFIYAVSIWLTLFFFIKEPMKGFIANKWLALLAAFAITSIIGISGVIRQAVNALNLILSTLWMAFLVFILFIVLAVILNKLGINIKQTIKAKKEAAAKEELERNRQVIKTEAKVAEEDLRSRADTKSKMDDILRRTGGG